MLIDFDIHRCSRRCAASARMLLPGEVYYSVLLREGTDVVRTDYAAEHWDGAPDGAIGWWRSRLPETASGKNHLAPNEVLMNLFDTWADDPLQIDARYVLALLLVRRRVLRIEDDTAIPIKGFARGDALLDEYHGQLRVYCPKRDEHYELPVATPEEERIEEIQSYLSELLCTDAE